LPKRSLVDAPELTATPDTLARAFYSLQTRADVVGLLQAEKKDIHYWFYRRGARYYQFQIPKRSGGHRVIFAPTGGTKLVQNRLTHVLNAIDQPRDNVHGFVYGRSILTNARPHVRQRWLLNLDLEDFFNSIHFGRVRGLFQKFGVGPDAADLLARICCHDGRLPQGAPTSPVVTNLICRPLDRALQAFARQHRSVMTRYADDITFSTPQPRFDEAIVEVSYHDARRIVRVGAGVRAVIEQNSFVVNESKVRLRSRSQRHEVTGLVVNERPNITRQFLRSVRGMIHAAERYGVAAAEQQFNAKYSRQRRPNSGAAGFLRGLRGKLEFARMVKGERNPTFTGLWNRACSLDARLAPKVGSFKEVNHALWVVEFEAEIRGGIQRGHGTAFALEGYGVVTAAHCAAGRVRMFQLIQPTIFYQATILRLCYDRDICVLELPDAAKSATLQLGSSAAMQVGTIARSAGFPDEPMSVASYEGRIARLQHRFGFLNLFTDFATRKGSSGAPLLDSETRVVGIVLYGPDRRPGADEDGPPSSAIGIDEIANVPAFVGAGPAPLT
jgi:RNA-directed DNA polymerase